MCQYDGHPRKKLMMIRHAPLVECNQSTTIRMILIVPTTTTTVPTSSGRRRRTPSIVETNATTCSSSSFSLSVTTTHSYTHSLTTDHNVGRTQFMYPQTQSLSLYIQYKIQYNTIYIEYTCQRERRERAAAATPHTPTLCRTSAPDRSILLIPSVENIMTLTR